MRLIKIITKVVIDEDENRKIINYNPMNPIHFLDIIDMVVEAFAVS